MTTSHRQRHDVSRLLLCFVAIGALAGCAATPSKQSNSDVRFRFPPLRHGIKAVFGPDGNDHYPDIEGRGARMIDAFHELGVDLTRIEFKWALIEPTRGTYDWSNMDRLINWLHENGIEPMLMVYCAPKWAMRGSPEDEQLFIDKNMKNLHTVVWPRREFIPDFERFCETAARRYKGKARLFEWWNEPDGMAGPIVLYDKDGKAADIRFGGDAAEYTRWLKHFHDAVKRGNPDAEIAAGSLSVHRTNFLEAIYAAGGKDYCDAISLHPYADDGINVEWVKECRHIMTRYGDWTKPIWLSEFGWNSNEDIDALSGKHAPRSFKYAQNVTAAFAEIDLLPYITHSFFFTLNDWNTSESGIDHRGTHHYGVMDLDVRIRRLGFYAFQRVVAKTRRLSRAPELPHPQFIPPATPLEATNLQSGLNLASNDGGPAFTNRFNQTCGQPCYVLTMDVQCGGDTQTHSGVLNTNSVGHTTCAHPAASIDFPLSIKQRPGTCRMRVSLLGGTPVEFPVTIPAKALRRTASQTVNAELGQWAKLMDITTNGGRMRGGFAWDAERLYVACIIKDELHEQPHRNQDIWKGDCIQLAIDPQRDAVRGSQYDINDSEFSFALSGDEAIAWRYFTPLGNYVGRLPSDWLAVKRVNDETHYEAAIPWSEIGVSEPAEGRIVGVAIAGCDWDNGERTVYKFGDGIIGEKQPYLFASIELAGN